MPLFSIVVPTRNRADLLENNVIPNLLRLNYKDHDIVFCDNASTDTTPTLLKKYAKDYSHIKYFRSEEWIAKEDFFQWSWKKATGDYVTLFFDDDYLTIRALEKVANILNVYETEIITYNRACVYAYPDYPVKAIRNKLNIPDFDRKAYTYNSRKHLENIFYLNDIYLPTPMVTNAFYKRDLLSRLEEDFGRFFLHGHMGDFNIACLTLNATSEFIYLNDPLAIFGFWSQNTQAQLHDLKTTMPEYQEWINWFTENYLKDKPFDEYVWPNNIAASLQDYSKLLNLNLKVNDRSHIITTRRKLKELKKLYPDNKIHNISKIEKKLLKYGSEKFGSKKIESFIKSMDIPPPVDFFKELELYKCETPEKFSIPCYLKIDGEGILSSINDAGWYFEGITGELISAMRPHLNNQDELAKNELKVIGLIKPPTSDSTYLKDHKKSLLKRIKRKLRTAHKVVQIEGVSGIIRVLKLKLIQRGIQI